MKVNSAAASGTAEGFQPVGLFDCSARGVGIVSLEPMDVGEQFLAELDGRHYKIGAELSALIGKAERDPHAALDALLGK